VNSRNKNRLSICKSEAPLANVVENLEKRGNDLTKRDHVIVLGGPGNRLGRNYCYSVKKDINFLAERSNNMNVRYVHLFRRHYKPWMNRNIDNIFVDNSILNLSSISPKINGLSDYGAKILTIKNIHATLNTFQFKRRTGLLKRGTVMNFQAQNETWESICKDNDSNHIFNSFLCTFLNIFQNSFPVK
jgi:hypothetical protein